MSMPERSPPLHIGPAVALALLMAWLVFLVFRCAQPLFESVDAVPAAFSEAGKGPGLGHPATADEIAGWDIGIAPDGTNLPRGGGTAAEGAELYIERCGGCHGRDGRGKSAQELVGGVGSLDGEFPEQTVGSYWPYAAPLFGFLRCAMPMNAPQSLTSDEIYALSAYLLYENGIIGETEEMNAETLPKVRMPNRDGFIQIYKEIE